MVDRYWVSSINDEAIGRIPQVDTESSCQPAILWQSLKVDTYHTCRIPYLQRCKYGTILAEIPYFTILATVYLLYHTCRDTQSCGAVFIEKLNKLFQYFWKQGFIPAKQFTHFHMTCVRSILGIRWPDEAPDTEVLSKESLPSVPTPLMEAQTQWTDHVIWMLDGSIFKQLLLGNYLLENTLMEGRKNIRNIH